MRILAALVLILAACGSRHHKSTGEQASSDRLAVLSLKKKVYCEEGKRLLAERRFMDDRCDSLLFTALWSTSCGPIPMGAWENPDKPGQWHRDPDRSCFLNGAPNGSASSISRDMFLGLWHSLWETKDKANVDEIVAYGEANNWIMGEAKDNETLLSRCLLTPQLISTLLGMRDKLSGAVALRRGEDDAIGINTGFRAHLDVLRILLNHKVFGAITDIEKYTLTEQAKRQPNNALFVAASEKFNGGTAALDLLLDSSHFPDDRLPNNHDEHCINYLHSRDEESSDWQPCKEEPLHVHDGTDFVFAASLFL